MVAALTRRTALFGALALPAAVVPAAAIPRMGDLLHSATAQERFDHHLAEFQRAAAELDPTIDRWSTSDVGMRLVVTAHRVTGRYVGDGYYEMKSSAGTWYVDYVQLSPDKIDGERTFLLYRWGSRDRHYMRVTESRLQEIIGARHSGRFGSAA